MALTRDGLVAGLLRVADGMESVSDELNAADGKLGDGDLGVTMVRGAREVKAVADQLPPEIGETLMKVAQAFTRTSGSSFGTLLATGMMSAAKATRGRTDIPWADVSTLLDGARAAMQQRGKAELGDKTILDALDAVAKKTAGVDRPDALMDAAASAVDEAMESFRNKPARIGRARIFGDRSVGLDDPGMLAFKRMLEALKAGA